VLTAAHCIDLVFTEPELQDADLENPYFAFTGEPDLTDYLEGDPDVTLPSDAVLAWDWVPHEEWDRMNVHYERLWETDDIGLIFLEEPITDVDPAVLPTREEADLLAVDDALEVVGWGMRDASDEDVTGEKYMGDSYISDIATWEFRVGLVEADVRKCHGDSGGPSFTRVDTESTTDMRLVGVTSHAWDATDCEEVGGVDTRADYYLEWIDGHMRSRCDDGTRVWCDEPGVLPPPMPKEEKRACGCSGVGPAWAGGAWVGLFALWGRRRRR